jgi:hypothetical protein
MKTYEVQAGEVLVIDGVRVAVLDIDDDRVLLQVSDNDGTRLEALRVPEGASETGLARQATPFV